jgi:hypothetical protein
MTSNQIDRLNRALSADRRRRALSVIMQLIQAGS